MATVKLRNDWFGPNGVLYRTRDNPHTFPKGWKLPKSAKAVPAAEAVDYSELQARQLEEHDILAIENAGRYLGDQPDEALRADVTPVSDEAAYDEAERRKELEGMNAVDLRKIAKEKEVPGVEGDDNKASIIMKILAAKK